MHFCCLRETVDSIGQLVNYYCDDGDDDEALNAWIEVVIGGSEAMLLFKGGATACLSVS